MNQILFVLFLIIQLDVTAFIKYKLSISIELYPSGRQKAGSCVPAEDTK